MLSLLTLATGPAPTDWLQGGVAAAIITFAGTVVKYLGSQNDKERLNTDKERARGDRLESSLLDKILPAIALSNSALDSMQHAMTDLQRQLEREQRK